MTFCNKVFLCYILVRTNLYIYTREIIGKPEPRNNSKE